MGILPRCLALLVAGDCTGCSGEWLVMPHEYLAAGWSAMAHLRRYRLRCVRAMRPLKAESSRVLLALALVMTSLAGDPGQSFAAQDPGRPVADASSGRASVVAPTETVTLAGASAGNKPFTTATTTATASAAPSGMVRASGLVNTRGALTFKQVVAANTYTCGLTTAGAAYCWGYNYGYTSGETFIDQSTPLQVGASYTWAQLTAGLFHVCGVTTAGTAYCWGSNPWGQFGNGTTTKSANPVPVSGGYTWASLTAGYWHTCGVTTSGAAYCWG